MTPIDCSECGPRFLDQQESIMVSPEVFVEIRGTGLDILWWDFTLNKLMDAEDPEEIKTLKNEIFMAAIGLKKS